MAEWARSVYRDEIARALDTYHPLKGAIFARDWLDEACETEDDEWRWECLKEAHRALAWLRRA